MPRRRLLLAALLLGLIAAYFALDLGHYLRLEYFRSQQSAIEEFRRGDPLAAGGVFFLIYVAVTALSLPGAAVMSLAAGAATGCARSTRAWRRKARFISSPCGWCPRFPTSS